MSTSEGFFLCDIRVSNYVKAKTTDLYVCMNLALIHLILLLSFHISTLVLSVKNAVSEHGITIWSIGSRSILYPWESFRDVGICKVHCTSRLPYEYDVVIRLSRMEEPRGPRTGTYGVWATELYELLHFRKIIQITFTQERLTQPAAVYPGDIADYRAIRRNAFDIS